jgi:hypothetical protein
MNPDAIVKAVVAGLFALILSALAIFLWHEHLRYDIHETVVVPAQPFPEPFQGEIANARAIEINGYHIAPQFRFIETSVVLTTEQFEGLAFADFISRACPKDISVAWGPAADPEIMKLYETVNTNNRTLQIRWRFPRDAVLTEEMKTLLNNRTIPISVGNNHIVCFDPVLRHALRSIKKGDNITLDGYLVDITEELKDGRRFTFKSSIRRDDVGMVEVARDYNRGSCEIVYPIAIRVDDRLYRGPDPFQTGPEH